MAEQPNKQPEASKAVITPKPETKDVISVPKEFSSINSGINIVVENGDVTINIVPAIVEEIGAYRRCKVKVKFKEGGQVQIIPDLK